MSQYYNSKRTRNLYDPESKQPFKLSRSKIDLFLNCSRCFYFDRRLGTARPPGFPFALNSAVDKLLKQEFDIHRADGTNHPLIEKYGVDARPVAHEKLNDWRENFVGVQYLHEPTNLLITGAIDDLWINSKDEYIVVDYKSTSKAEEITELNKDWQDGYKVSNIGYFVYCNGITDKKAFDAKLEFDITLIAYEGDDSWVEKAIENAHQCLQSDTFPESGEGCDYCAYREAIKSLEN